MDSVKTGIPRHENMDRVVTPFPNHPPPSARHLEKEGVRDGNNTME